MWADCGSVFNNLSDLVGHVNLQHLCAIDTQNHSSTLPVPSQDHPNLLSQTLSCHWGDCAMSPSSSPSSSASLCDDIISILTTHLMQDHLGLPPLPTPQPPLADPHDFPDAVSQPPISPDPSSHDCSGIHACKWKACSQTFSSCDDLTAHIASVHIGGGKAHYECFWAGCNRHGTHGFSSKQKISRHLQVRLFVASLHAISLMTHSSHTLATALFSASYATKVSPRRRPSSSTCAATHKRVSRPFNKF